ncbi:hypothetical protein Poli38472_008355 [Pythium oligandrum]|uniref:NADH:flavin oxidoreductase/NADH oxidase N-terminal domain-containing protein n=1 Tax=Pythium oligandrum TaxID=41045 RepID=A0A8K1FPK3_PYTOL|nr:hypothetical protein Poli38472_008355 [Pythium oligandrum]|eukprot:TMW65713.1 hypothetical protein Poli38472_008355 [Pythium oligandrum]
MSKSSSTPLTTTNYKLFTPLKLGEGLTLKNRVVMSPMTRSRCDPVLHRPGDLTATYYAQRAGAGLIISEATAVSKQGYGWYGSPGIYNREQMEAWKKVVKSVHAKDGQIFLQIWHMGRQAQSSFNPEHEIVAPSAIPATLGRLRNSQGEYTTKESPRVLETDEIPAIIEDFRKSAALTEAGFDGIELHAAGGYLIDQFLQSVTNKRRTSTAFKGPVFATASYTRDIAEGAIRSGGADAVGFSVLYISNPDLAERFQNDWPLNPLASEECYHNPAKGAEGYTTWPAYTPSEQ